MDGQTWMAKKYLKSKPLCKVTFHLPKEGTLAAQSVTLAGDFNNWDQQATPMKRRKNGDFMVIMELEKDRDYRFRYCIDGERWETDWSADRFAPNPFGGYDSVVVV